MMALIPARVAGAIWLILAATSLIATVPLGPALGADDIQFNRDIRPILAQNCLQCHGFDEQARKAELRLDTFEDATKDHQGIVAVRPGDPESSQVWLRINEMDPDLVMPPPSTKKRLTAAEKELLRRWITAGASFQTHWSFTPVQTVLVPSTRHAAGAITPLDSFIVAGLERKGLQLAPPAEKATLLRRVTLDLTGMPPSLEELDAFLRDDRPDAFEKQVDRLLASSQYGEHLAAWWCDLARYADSNGFQNDFLRQQWPWRDWVINAFNRNMPFDQFTIAQLAGDLLPNATRDQQIATGFHRNNRTVTEAGSVSEEWRAEYVVDRVETTSAVWMGLTLGCCRCHDHKYDPFTQRDFYRLAAYFNNIAEEGVVRETPGNVAPMIKVPLPQQQSELDRLSQALQVARVNAETIFKEADAERLKWEAGLSVRSGEAPQDFLWHAPLAGDLTVHLHPDLPAAVTVRPRLTWTGVNKLEWMVTHLGPAAQFPGRPGQSLELSNAPAPAGDRPFTFSVWLFLTDAKSGGTVASCIDENDHLRGWDLQVRKRATFHLIHDWEDNALEVSIKHEIPSNAWQHLLMAYDGSQRAGGVTFFLNGQRCETEILKDSLSGDTAVAQPVRLGLRTSGSPFQGQLRDVRCYGRELNPDEAGQLFSIPYETLAAIPPAERTQAQQTALDTWFRARHSAAGQAALRTIAACDDELKKYTDSLATVMVMAERPERRETRVFIRGRYDDLGEQVSPGTPPVLPPLPAVEAEDRLALARWLVSPEHPLTSRVLVNRLWERMFGIGLTSASEDFGTQGELPAHPALLDWLAGQLLRPSQLPAVNGRPPEPWDLKALQKLIVMSAVYQQSSVVTPALLERDPENRLLARGPRVRLSAETIRDQALAVSGLLTQKVGGPSVKPYQPPGVWEELLMLNAQYDHDQGEALYRRTLYTLVRRTAQQPSLAIFDAPSREVCVVKRPRTNTPLQALCLRNDVTYVEAARRLAQLMMSQEGTGQDRLRWGFRRVTSRWPHADELAVLQSGFERRLQDFRHDLDAAGKLVAYGDSPVAKHLDPVELAAYTTTASVLLNLDEAITKQ